MTTLSIKDVWKARGSGRREVQVLQGIDLELERGDIALLEGPSGSGKTTLLTIAAGLLTADKGEVVLAGSRLGSMDARQRGQHRAHSVGFVFQRANLLEGLTAIENVLLAADLAGMPSAQALDSSRELFRALDIEGLQDRKPQEISGGEEHRVALARAVIHRPALVLADEPTGNLDSESGQAVMALLERLVRQSGVSLLIATHDTRLQALPARLLQMRDGRLHESPRDNT